MTGKARSPDLPVRQESLCSRSLLQTPRVEVQGSSLDLVGGPGWLGHPGSACVVRIVRARGRIFPQGPYPRLLHDAVPLAQQPVSPPACLDRQPIDARTRSAVGSRSRYTPMTRGLGIAWPLVRPRADESFLGYLRGAFHHPRTRREYTKCRRPCNAHRSRRSRDHPTATGIRSVYKVSLLPVYIEPFPDRSPASSPMKGRLRAMWLATMAKVLVFNEQPSR